MLPPASSYNDYSPITYFRRVPIYVTTIITALFVAGMFATAFMSAARLDVQAFAFSPGDVWQRGAVWQILTYPLLQRPQFFYIFSIFFFYWFGVDVERYLGRIRYLKLFALLVLVPLLLLSIWWKITGTDYVLSGSNYLGIGFFVAFATLYPNLEYWGWITMKWLAFAGILLSSMNYLPERDWPGLAVLLVTCECGFGYVSLLQSGISMPNVFRQMFRRKPKLRVMPSPAQSARTKVTRGAEVVAEIDSLLDKIAKHGLASLTARERERLERASEALKKK